MDKKKLKQISQQIAEKCSKLSEDMDFKTSLGKTNNAWNKMGFNQFTTIGPIMKVFRAQKDERLKDCWEYILEYLTLGEEREKKLEKVDKKLKSASYRLKNPQDPLVNKEKYQIGRSYEYLQELADEFKSTTKLPNKEMAFDFIVYRMFYQTYIGKLAEEKVRDFLNKMILGKYDAKAIWAPDEYDAKYSVDLIVEKNGTEIVGIQVKPTSYIQKTKAQAHEEQIKLNKTHNGKYKKLTDCDTIYVYYDECFKPSISQTELNKLKKLLKGD